MAGLRSFDTPNLEAIERRRFQLWLVSLLLLVVVASAVILLTAFQSVILPSWLTPRWVQISLMGMIILFCAYAIEKEIQLGRLTRVLIDERVLTASLTSRIYEVQSLLEAGKAINLDLNLEEVVSTILSCARELLDGHDCSIQLCYGDDELRTVNIAGQSAAAGARMKIGQGIAGRVAETREPVLINGQVEHKGFRKPTPAAPNSAMSVHLVHRNVLLGVLNVNARDHRIYTEHDLRAFGIFGEQAAIALANAQLYEAQRLTASQTTYRALHDGLTGLPNRALFLDRVDHALSRRREASERVALLFVDLDDFKRINDSLGHLAGDAVIAAFAERLRAGIRAADTVARFGGDEFAVLVDGISSDAEARRAADRIYSELSRPIAVADREVRIGASIGIAIGAGASEDDDGGENSGSSELLRNADTALHVAKSLGKNQVTVFEPSMRAEVLRRFDLESDLDGALDRLEVTVHYQPIHQLSTREIVGVEALVRWNHPRRGLLAAGAWVPLAEQIGLLPAIDRFVLAETCRTLAPLLRERSDFSVNINLSPARLQDPSITSEVQKVLDASGVDPSHLVFEITESAMLRDGESTARRLNAIRSLGIRLALDDFGTGYSSLSHLRRFPVDTVKIDRTFVEELNHAQNNGSGGHGRTLIEAILRLGHGLNLAVIAEGIESEQQASSLVDLGCDLGQGYLLARPMPIEDLRSLLG
ncbi:MAG: GGDEF domain-containing protein [Thermoanaerobaculia bacterium]|nr:GGDEF domain-containing protein [Thermoanaerobaculia bacterium]